MTTGTLDIEITLDPKKRERQRRVSPLEQATAPRIPRITRLMALAIKFQNMVDRGEVRDYADLARLGYVSRARLTQIMNLLLLAPDIQEQLLLPESTTANVCEPHLRRIADVEDWTEQRSRWASLRCP